MSKPRITRWVAVLAILPALLAACGGGSSGDQAGGSGSSGGGPVKLTFWSWVPGIQNAVDAFNKTHPDIHVDLVPIPAGSAGGYAKMYSALKAGNAPDLAQVEYQEIPAFLLANGLVDITKYVSGAQEKFVPWQWQQVTYDGAVYAVPQASGPMGLFYRKDLFDAWGIEPPATWADFAAAAEQVRQHDAYISTFPPGNSAWFTSLAWQAGAKWFSTEGDTWVVDIDNPTTQKVASYWQDLVARKLVKTEPDFANGWYKDLQTGKIAAWVSAQWGDAIIRGNAPKTKGKWAVAPMPQWNAGEHRSANWGGSSTAVLKGSEHAKEASEFAVWLNTDPKSIDLLIKDGYGWPAAKAGESAPALTAPSDFFGGQKYNDIFAASDRNIDESWKWIPTTSATYQHLNDGFQAAVAGKGTFGEAVTKAQQQTIADLEAKGLKVQAK